MFPVCLFGVNLRPRVPASVNVTATLLRALVEAELQRPRGALEHPEHRAKRHAVGRLPLVGVRGLERAQDHPGVQLRHGRRERLGADGLDLHPSAILD